MTISKVVNMNRRRDNTYNKTSATVGKEGSEERKEDEQVLFAKRQKTKIL